MKKNSLFLCAIVIAILGLLNSCEKDNATTVTLNLTNQSAKDSVYTGESVIIAGAATTTGKLSMIQFFSSYPFNGGESEVEVAGTKIISFNTEASTDFSVEIKNIKNSTKIRLVVTDQNGQETSSIFAITLRNSNILAYTNLQLGGWDSSYGSCLDVDAGQPYSGSAVDDPAKRALIDLFFEDAKLGNRDLDSMYYNNISRLPDTGIRYAATTFSSADYDAMKGDDLFKNLEATLKIVPVKLNDIVFFKAKSGKKGLLRVTELTAPMGDIKLDEKIQK